MKTISRYIMTLALLLTAVTGAWADETPIVTITATGSGPAYSVEGIVTLETGGASYTDVNGWNSGSSINLTVTAADGVTITKVKFTGNKGSSWEDTESPFQVLLQNYYVKNTFGINIGPDDGVISIEVYGTIAPTEPAIEVTPGEAANTWTFVMPAFDVEIAPIYAPTAVFATDGEPTTIEGIIAGEAKDIVKAGTVATTKIGEADPIAQGTVMYVVTTENKKPTSTTGFSATVPTGAVLTGSYTENQTVYVWYYIKGIDAAEGETATAENTFNDSEICETPLKVTVLSNKFDIQFNAANANTIEAGKATVKVGETAAEVKEGKLTGVKMNSKVTVTAKEGYKFRKVEVKKGAAKPLANATTEDLGKVVGADGNIYANKDAAEAVATGNAVAMICYVNEGHGLALALTDEVGNMNWSTAQTTCAAHTPAITGGTWKLASKGEWNNMISAAGSYSALRDGFSSVGGTNMQSGGYWSSTEDDSSDAWNYYFSNGLWSDVSKDWNRCVRACLAF